MTLKLNSRCEQVKVIQEFLGIIADGIFDPITHQAILKFQKENNLIVDGTEALNKVVRQMCIKRKRCLVTFKCFKREV